jgi:hypothetical protein
MRSLPDANGIQRHKTAHTKPLSRLQSIPYPSQSRYCELSTGLDRPLAFGQKKEESASKPRIVGSSNKKHTDVNDTSQDATDKKGKKSLRTRFRRLADKFR